MSRHLALLLLFATSGGSIGCATVDRTPEKLTSQALNPAESGVLAETSREVSRQFGPTQSGFHLLTSGKEALDWRLALLDHATTSVDIQYYIWDRDDAGALLLSRLLEAADRGVRVRLLIDDFQYAGNDRRLAAICQHPHIEIRLFNPQYVRSGFLQPLLEFTFRFNQLNRRMHNKVFVVDNRLAIIGGRNIADAYFGLGDDYNFVDLDVLVAGRAVQDVSEGFDEFWNSEPAFPGDALVSDLRPEEAESIIDSIRKELAADAESMSESPFSHRRKDWHEDFAALAAQWHKGTALMVQDAPVTKSGVERRRLVDQAPPLVDPESPSEILFVSPYLVPREEMLEVIAGHSERGVDIMLLAPSLAANDLPLVHSHYRQYRRPLLKAGASLHELRAQPSESLRELTDTAPNRADKVMLHLKGGVGDRQRCFIGSLNLDPRSLEINTEAGLFIESPSLSQELAEHFQSLMAAENAWLVTSDQPHGKGQLRWRSNDREVTMQPADGPGSRIVDLFFGILPIRNQL